MVKSSKTCIYKYILDMSNAGICKYCGDKKFINFYQRGSFPAADYYMQAKGIIKTDPNSKYMYRYDGDTYDGAKQQPVSQAWSR